MRNKKHSSPFLRRRTPFPVRLLFFSFLLVLPAPTILTAETFSKQTPIQFESDNLEYKESHQIIVASGNVKVQQSSYTFHSDHAVFNIPNRTLEASGLVRFRDVNGNEIRSQLLRYDADKGSAELLNAEGSFGPWLFAAKKVQRDDQSNYYLERARLTTCGADLSKYHLYGHKIKILPQRRLTVLHALFRLGPVPVLYLPYYYYSLGEKHLAFQFFPGTNQSEGPFARTVWGYPTSDYTYTRLYIDYLSRRGVGTGGEINYAWSDRAKGSVYGFRIDDDVTHQERWNARFFHWQRLSPHLILQTNANRLSDDQFPNDFFREDFNRVVRDLKSSLALTYQKNNLILRILGERSDQYDLVNREFIAGEMLSPKLEINHVQSRLGFLGLDKIFSFTAANRFAGTSPSTGFLSRHYRRESDAQFTLLRGFQVSRATHFVPKISLKNQWSDRPQGNEFNENYIQRANLETVVRQQLGHFLDVDLTYLMSMRFQANQGEDQGIEDHTLSFLSWLRPSSLFGFRFETAHLLPRFKGESLTPLNREKYLPLRGEINVTPRNNIELFFREEYTLADPVTGSMHPLNVQSEITFGQRALGRDYFSMASSYFSSRDNAFELRHSGRYSPSDKLKLEGALRTLLFYENANLLNVSKAEMLEKELLVRTEWRCWELSFTFRERKGVLEFLFNLELKLERLDREKTVRTDKGSEWYPWRAWK